jgi:hypothetical protein
MKKITKIFTTLSLVALLGSCSLSNLRYKEVSYATFKEKALATAEKREELEEFTEIEAKVKVEKDGSKTESTVRLAEDDSRNQGTEEEQITLTFIVLFTVDFYFGEYGEFNTEEVAEGKAKFYTERLINKRLKLEFIPDKESGDYDETYFIYNEYGFVIEASGVTYEANRKVETQVWKITYK